MLVSTSLLTETHSLTSVFGKNIEGRLHSFIMGRTALMYRGQRVPLVIKYRFPQFGHILGFFIRLHVYFREAAQEEPELVVKMEAAVSQR